MANPASDDLVAEIRGRIRNAPISHKTMFVYITDMQALLARLEAVERAAAAEAESDRLAVVVAEARKVIGELLDHPSNLEVQTAARAWQEKHGEAG